MPSKTRDFEFAEKLHGDTPPDWYYQSLKIDPLQRFWHKRRFKEAAKFIEPVSGYVLDIGSADGMFSKVILDKSQAKGLVGIDILKTSVTWANKHWKNVPKMKFLVRDAQNMGFKAGEFDAAFAMESFEHVVNPKKVISDVKKFLKKGGYAVFLVPSDSRLFKIVWFIWLKFYPRGWVWKDTHIQTFRNNYLIKICREAGFTIEKEKRFNLGMLQIVKVRKV